MDSEMRPAQDAHRPTQNLGSDAQSLRPQNPRGSTVTELVEHLASLGVQPVLEYQGAESIVQGISMDSRAVRPGDLYVALPGAKVHGAQFVQKALDTGAHAILTDTAGARMIREAHLPLESCSLLVSESLRPVLGSLAALIYGSQGCKRPDRYAVTGTNGKTTTTYMLESLFRSALSAKTGLIGTIQILVDGVSIPSALTTPESVHVHSLLSIMREQGVTHAAMEVSSHAIDYHRVDGVTYKVSGFTNLTQDHLDLHGTMNKYFDSKAQLFTPERTEYAVITADDEWGEKMLRHAQSQLGTHKVVRLVTGHGAGVTDVSSAFGARDWAVLNVERDGLGHRFTLTNGAGEAIPCCTHMPADFNVSNAALAALMAYTGASEEERDNLRPALADGAALTPVVPGRMQLISSAPHTIVDFAHNPDGLTRALDAMDRPGGGRVIIVFGATGERDHLKRPLMGEIAAQHADIVIVTDDDPHGEDPAPIREAVIAGAERAVGQGARATQILNISPREAAIARAVKFADERDAILIAGRGHETAQDVAGTDVHLDDRIETAKALVVNNFEILPDYRRMLEEA